MADSKILESMLLSLIEKIEKQHESVDKRLDNIEKVMLFQEINLKNHMKRSDSLEEIVNKIKEEDLKPLEKHVNMIEGIFKFLGLLALVLTIAGGITSLFHLI